MIEMGGHPGQLLGDIQAIGEEDDLLGHALFEVGSVLDADEGADLGLETLPFPLLPLGRQGLDSVPQPAQRGQPVREVAGQRLAFRAPARHDAVQGGVERPTRSLPERGLLEPDIRLPRQDTGKLEDMLEANRLILDTLEARNDGRVSADSRVEGKVVIGPGAMIERSIVRGPVIIGANARIAGAYIGPFTSIGDRAEIRETEIEHSIVLEGAVITDLANRIEDSLIGRNVQIYRVPRKPSAYRFMLGDNSEVGIRW